MNANQQQEIKVHSVWDLPVRLFHWVNFLSVISLLFMGFIMLYKKELGITSLEAKIGLKQVHVVIGYVFVVNLLIRFAWAFIGNRFARWSAFLPYRDAPLCPISAAMQKPCGRDSPRLIWDIIHSGGWRLPCFCC